MADSDTGAAAPGVSNPPCPVPSTAYPPVVVSFIRQFLTETEVTQLGQQFQSSWQPNRQVMWTGNIRYKADEWARRKRMRTLSIAMGPLEKNGEALGIHKSKEKGGRTQYMRGASALFAWYITADDVVTILCPPPPERFNPGGGTNLQLVELPILIGIIGGRAVSRIEVVHPMIKGAENFSYQLWPVDEVNTWLQNFAQASIARFPWLRRARPSRVLNIERLLRSMLSDSTDPIYHAMLPQEGLASTTMLTLASSEGYRRKRALETQQRMTIVGGIDAALPLKSKIKEPNVIQVREKGASVTTDGLATASKESKSKKGLEIHQQVPDKMRLPDGHSATTQAQGESKKPASSPSQSSKESARRDQDGASIRGEISYREERSIKSYEKRSAGAPAKGLTATKKAPGKAKGIKTSTTLSFQVNTEGRAATPAARTTAKKGKEVEKVEKPEEIKTSKKKKKKKKKQADPGASMVGQELEAGKSSSKKKAADHCKITIHASTSGCVRK